VIERYSRPGMSALWSLQAQYRTWLDIEVLACEGWHRLGKIPKAAMEQIRDKAAFDLNEVLEIERETRHDVAAFVSNMQSKIGEAGRHVHLGLTSSDIVDTAFSCRLKASADLLLKELEACLGVTANRALRDRDVVMIARTHGIHAEPTTMGVKWLLWHDALARCRARLVVARSEIAVGKLSGAVGNYAHVPPEVEAFVCERLGLAVDPLSTQIVARDRHAAYFSALGLLGSVVETIAVELRHLQRSEVGEVREGFSKGQKGSSAMPHKRNPITAENLTGLARLLRGMVLPAMENCALWHERDISHSSVERVIGPDSNILADFMLARLRSLLESLEIQPDRMKENLGLLQGVIYSQRVLLALVESGLSRDDAYLIVQKHALEAMDKRKPFLGLLKADRAVTERIAGDRLESLFDPRHFLAHLDTLYAKVLGSPGKGKA